MKLDSITTVVDAKNLGFQLKQQKDSSSFPEAVYQIAFAAVREKYKILPSQKWKNDETVTNQIVFIGRNLNEDILSKSFEDCISTVEN